MSEQAENSELLKFLESGEFEVVGKIKQVIHENLYSAKDATLLNSLIDSYVQSKSDNLLEIITGVNESQCQYLFEKMNDLLKRGMHMDVSSLFLSIIHHQPSWLYKIVSSAFFTNYLKSLRTQLADQDVIFLMSSAIIISMLLPCVPSLVAPFLGDILEIFIQLATYLVYKPASLPDILTLHLHIGVYILYHRLYAMYPNNFLSYIRSHFGSKGNDPVFRHVIQPMSQFVKFHPGLILDTSKSETNTTKWKTFQPHDIFAECQKISLDPLDAIKEASYAVFSPPAGSQNGATPRRDQVFSKTVSSADVEKRIESSINNKSHSSEPKAQEEQSCSERPAEPASYLCSQEVSAFWSPSFLCGLSTPPSSRTMSPANSAQDILSLSEFVQRPMTPIVDVDKEEHSDTRTSTPDNSRRKSAGEIRKLAQKIHKSPQLYAKSKSDDPVDVKIKRLQQEAPKGEILLEIDQTKLSPKKKREKQTTGVLERSSPRLPRTEHVIGQKQQTHSAPTTPAISSKENFSFNSMQSQNQLEVAYVEGQGRPTAFIGANHQHDGKRPASAFQPLATSRNMPESPMRDLDSNLSLLRFIKELNQEVLSTMNGQGSQNQDQVEQLDGVIRSKTKSPLELLDEFIECGSNLHSHQLSRIPITSQLDTDWTYFGGTTPADELSILKSQVNLFEVQLQYERYKCDQHVLRNRRLVGKAHKAQGLEDDVNGLRNQVFSLESQLSEAKSALKYKDFLNRKMQDDYRGSEREKQAVLEKYLIENEKLRYRIEEFMKEVSTKDSEMAHLSQKLKSVQHELFDKTSELDRIKPSLEKNEAIKAKADDLAKALVTYQDKYERIKRQFLNFEANYVGGVETDMENESLRNEIKEFKLERENLITSLEATNGRIADLEAVLAIKEVSLRDMKTSMEQIHQKHAGEVKILEERYNGLKKVIQRMESYILYLFTKIEETGRDLRPHGHSDGRKRTGRHDGHARTSSLKKHGEDRLAEQNRKTHLQGLPHVPDVPNNSKSMENSIKGFDDETVRLTPTKDLEKSHGVHETGEKEAQLDSSEHHIDSYSTGQDKLVKDWMHGGVRTRNHPSDDAEKHVNDSGIEHSGIL